MTNSEKHQLRLKNQIRQAGEWLIANCNEMVSDIVLISDYKIYINLQNGDTPPTIRFEQENIFWDYEKFANEVAEYEKYEENEKGDMRF